MSEPEQPEPPEPTPCTSLVAPDRRQRRAFRVGARVLTFELAKDFAETLLSDLTHTVESAALEAGLRPSTVREAIRRYHADECRTLEDEEICELVVRAKTEHIKQIRKAGYVSAGRANRAGTAWIQWQLEVQAPLEHPRKQQTQVELSGPEGGPVQTSSAVRYVVSVPPEEPDE